MTLFESEFHQPTIAFRGSETFNEDIYNIFYNNNTKGYLKQHHWRFVLPFDDTIRLQIHRIALRGTEAFNEDNHNIFYNSNSKGHLD